MSDKKKLAIDAVVLVAYLVAANPALTGVSAHEWIGLGALVVLAVHVVVSADRLTAIARSLRRGKARGKVFGVGRVALDALTALALVTCVVSGLMVSGAVLPAFGFYADGYYFWNPLHAVSAKVLLALILVHVVTHWKWITGFFGKGKRRNEHD